MPKDKEYISLVNSNRWRRLRREKLSRCPLCERCNDNGIVRAATEVHHVTPIECGLTFREKERLAYSYSNLAALCHECHVKVHDEMGRSGKAASKRIQNEYLTKFIKKFIE